MAHIEGRWEDERPTQEYWDSVRARLKVKTAVLQGETHVAAQKVRASNCFTRREALSEFEHLIQKRKERFEGERAWRKCFQLRPYVD